MGDGQARFVRRFASQGKQEGNLFGSELAGAAGTRLVVEKAFDGLAQGREILGTFDADQVVESSLPTPPPKADLVAFKTDLEGDRFIVDAGEGQEDDGSALDQSFGQGSRDAEFVEDLLLTLGDHDFGSGTGHSSPILDFRSSSWQYR